MTINQLPPASTHERQTPFNDNWTFRSSQNDVEVPVRLPHDAMIHETRSPTAGTRNHGGYFPGGRYTYRRRLLAPQDLDQRRIRLRFEGVYGRTAVRINGIEAASWDSGYREETVDLTALLTAGAEADIEVEVDNTDTPNSRWYTGSGVYRPVWLLYTRRTHILEDRLAIVTRTLAGLGAVEVSVDVHEAPAGAELQVELLDGHDVVGRAVAPILRDSSAVAIDVANPRPWSAEDPYLYSARVRVVLDGEVLDELTERVGLRTITVDATAGLRINGKPVLLRGACVHHDNGVLGAATHAAAEWRRARILKDNGFNAIRSSHNPLSRAFLDACDELGLYVLDELTDVWTQSKTPHDGASRFRQDWQQDADALIAKDRNRPSVIMYSIGNEIAETALPQGVDIAAELSEYFRAADPERPTTVALNFALNVLASFGRNIFDLAGDPSAGHEKASGRKEKKASAPNSTVVNALAASIGPVMQQLARIPRADKATRDALSHVDVAGYNYAFLRYAADRKRHPNRVILGTESMPGDLPKIWSTVQAVPGAIGDFMWTGWDYLGESGIGTLGYKDREGGLQAAYPALVAGPGAIDILGVPNTPAFLARAVWNIGDALAIAVRPLDRSGEKPRPTPWRVSDAVASWSWAGYEGRTAAVEVYAAADEVELRLNGRLIGRKRAGAASEYVARFSAPYEKGELTAIAFTAGREVARRSLQSAERPALTVRVEDQDHIAERDGLWHVWIELADQAGVIDTSAVDSVSLDVEGAVLEGFGSASPSTTERFTDNTHTTFHGRALAVVRALHGAQFIRLTATSRSHGKVSLTFGAE